jgi:peptidoglycan/xylan/chitin deacetylase (PgdA/CDA1 family)
MSACFLVYHRLADHGANRRFHDVAPALWERHLDRLAHLGAAPMLADPLLRLADGRNVALTFDDGTADHLNAARALDRRGWRGVFMVPAGLLGESGRLSDADVAALAASGHAIGSHGWSHRRFDQLSERERANELAASRDRLGGITGSAPVWLAPPGGLWPAAATAQALELGYRHARGTAWGVAADGWRERPATLLPAFVLSGRVGPQALAWLLRARSGGVFDRLARMKEGVKRLTGEAAWDRMREGMRR